MLKERGATTKFWKTGRFYMKRYSHETGALVGFEKSGHFFFNPPLGRGYDDGLVAASRCSTCSTATRTNRLPI